MFRGLVLGVTFTSLLALGGWGASSRADVERSRARELAERELELSAQLMPALYRLNLEATLARATSLATSAEVRGAFSAQPHNAEGYLQRHDVVDLALQKAREALSADEDSTSAQAHLTQKIDIASALEAWRAGRPSLLFVVDDRGVCVAHASNPRCYAEDAEGTQYTRMAERFPALKRLLSGGEAQGRGFTDLWIVDDKPVLVGVAPINAPAQPHTKHKRGTQAPPQPAGALIIGYPLNKLALHYQARLGLEVAFTRDETLSDSSTLTSDLEVALQGALQGALKGALKGDQAALNGVELEGKAHLARGVALGESVSGQRLGCVLLTDWSARLSALPSGEAHLFLALLAFLVCAGVVVFAHQRLLAPFRAIDLGLMEVREGNRDYWFSYEIKGDALSKTIAYQLDMVMSRYFDRPEPELASDQEDELRGGR